LKIIAVEDKLSDDDDDDDDDDNGVAYFVEDTDFITR